MRERQAHCLLGGLNHNTRLTKTTTTCIYQSYSQSLPYNKDWKKYLSERVRAAALVGSNVLIVLFYFVDFSFPKYLNQCGAYVIVEIDHYTKLHIITILVLIKSLSLPSRLLSSVHILNR